MYQLNNTGIFEALDICIQKDLVPFITGSPGVGKSDTVKQLATKYNLKLIDVRLSQCEPIDLMGMPYVLNGKTAFIPPLNFPLETDSIPDGYDGWLVFLDEFNSASIETSKAAYKILLDKMIDNTKLHSRVRLIAAGNKDTDKAYTTKLSTAIQSRLIHLTLEVDHTTWLEWANKNGIDHRIISFIKFKPEILHRFSPTHADHTFPCPRTWAFASKLIEGMPNKFNNIYTALLAGTVGAGASAEFKGFSEIYKELPTIEDILEKPSEWRVPDEPSRLYAITTMLSRNMSEATIEPLMTALDRIPIEFQVITMKDIYKTPIKGHSLVKQWLVKNSSKMF